MRGRFGMNAAIALLAATTARAQSLNLNFAPSLVSGPASTYPAAGLAGTWNIIEGTQGTHYYNLARLSGSSSAVEVYNIGGSQLLTNNHLGTTGNDQDLLDHYLVTFNPNLEVCLFFHDLEDSQYEIITYAWLPDSPLIDSYVSVDDSGDPPALVGGTWGGAHEAGVTFSVHRVDVVGGYLYSHSGIPPASGFVKAGLNGVQLRKINPITPEDIDGDEDVDLADYAGFQQCHDIPGKMGWRPLCPDFDQDGDDDVDLKDFAQFQGSFDAAA